MKTIVCYGDSNTWGWRPIDCKRYVIDQRWTGILAKELGPDYRVIEEGLNGRTTVWDDPVEDYRNGKSYLMPCLLSHSPVDLVMIMLGTNDLKYRFCLSAFDIAAGAGVLVDMAQNSKTGPDDRDSSPMVLLMAPPPLGKLDSYKDMFQGGSDKSKLLGKYFSQVAKERNCYFLDTAEVIASSDIDGLHLLPEEHMKLGKRVSKVVQEIFMTK
ncbi:MAG TPA: hydrolase [Firmicutes bacterium]|jgi:lysophospholipase L1-like esterase|nr:hydrolase [Bacillota bacterium]